MLSLKRTDLISNTLSICQQSAQSDKSNWNRIKISQGTLCEKAKLSFPCFCRPLSPPENTLSSQLECDNFITVIQKVNDTMIVCGTNAGNPRCWMLVSRLLPSGAPPPPGRFLDSRPDVCSSAGERQRADRRPGRPDRFGLRHLAGLPVAEVHQPARG